MKRHRGKLYKKTIANERNTPHLRENTWIIVMSYLLSGLHFVVLGAIFLNTNRNGTEDWGFVVMGIALLMAALVSLWDNRKSERGKGSAIACGILHLAICVFFSVVSSFWWMAVYAGEVVLCLILIAADRKRRKRNMGR